MTKKSIFSLDSHVKTDMNIKSNVSLFKSVLEYVFRIPKRPITSLAEAKVAWGIENFSDPEIRKFSERRLTAGIVTGIVFCLLLFFSFYTYYLDCFGLFSGIGYCLAGFSALSVAAVCLWQSDMLNSETFIPFYEYITKYKWLFSFILFAACFSMQIEGAIAVEDLKVDIPIAEIKSTDLSSIFVGHIIGGPWTKYIEGGTGDLNFISSLMGFRINEDSALYAPAMSTVLTAILSCLNMCALSFVSVFSVYIFTFGSVQVANSGDWKDSQVFSTFWSPVRTVGAIALCSPISNGVSLLQHFILLAIAMSISLANNVSNEFVKYIKDETNLYSLGTPSFSTGKDNFPLIFQTLLHGVVAQVVKQNIHHEKMNEPGIKDEEFSNNQEIPIYNKKDKTIDYKQITGHAYQITLTNPDGVYKQDMPSLIISDNEVSSTGKQIKGSKSISYVYVKAIKALYKDLYDMTSLYITSDIKDRRGLTQEEIDSKLKTAIDNYLSAISSGSANHIRINSEMKALIAKMGDQTSNFGWLTLGVYPFIISQAQSKLQESVSVRIDYVGGSPLNDIKAASTGGIAEHYIIPLYLDEISVGLKKLSMAGIYYEPFSNGKGASSDSLFEKLAYKALGIVGLHPEQLFAELENTNAVAVLYSKGYLCLKVAKTLLDSLNKQGTPSDNLSAIAKEHNASDAERQLIIDKANSWYPIILVACGVLASFGISCAFILPALPIIFWARATVSWAVLIVQTLMGAPFWAASHVLPEGIGLAGQHAKKGYLLLLDVFLRPCLLVCGAIMVMLLIETWTKVFSKVLYFWYHSTLDVSSTGAGMNFLTIIVTTAVSLYVIYTTIRWLYIQAIGDFPQRVIQWCGGQSADAGTQDVLQNVQNITGKMQEFVNRMGGGGYGSTKYNAEALNK